MKRATLFCVCAAAVVAALPANADPVTTSRVGVVTVELPAGQGHYVRVSVLARDLAGGDELSVDVATCSADECSPSEYYTGKVSPSAVTLDATAATGRLSTVLGGIPMAVSWRPSEGGTVVIGGLRGTGDGTQNSLSMYNGQSAATQVRLSRLGCTGFGMVGDHVQVAAPSGGSSADHPLSSLRLRAGDSIRCDS